VLEEVWRVGRGEGQELALPAGVAVDDRGFAAIPDFQLSEVIVIDSSGRWLGSRSRRGSGPGEIRMPIAVTWDREGSAVVWDAEGSKVVWLGADRSMRSDETVDPVFNSAVLASGQVLWAAVQPDGSVLTTIRGPADHGDTPDLQREFLVRRRPGAESTDTLAANVVRTLDEPYSSWTVPGYPGLLAAVDRNGRVAISDSPGSYRIRLDVPDAFPVVLCRVDPAAPISEDERGGGGVSTPGSIESALRDAAPTGQPHPVGRLFFDVDGRLWVQRDRPVASDAWDRLYGVAGATYDVFSREGRLLGEVRAQAAARLQSARGDFVWALELTELDEPELVQYRMSPPL
jgi:hypothetical protein